MFINWGFLLSEMVVLLVLAAVVGLIAGWILWGRRAAPDTSYEARLMADLAAAKRAGDEKSARIAMLEDQLATAQSHRAGTDHLQADEMPVAAIAPEAEPLAAEPAKPAALAGPRGGQPDDLTRIRGVGPKLMKLVNDLGFYHFDQIAAWTPAEVAWVDDNLTGFKGRVSRDNWVGQAAIYAKGG